MINVPKWYDKTLSDKLNLPDNNFLQTKSNLLRAHCFEFINKTDNFDHQHENILTVDKKTIRLENRLKDETNQTKMKTIKTKINKLKNNINKTTICKKITIYPNNDQKSILHKWFDECEKLYNFCVDKYNNDNKYFDGGYMKHKLQIFSELYGNNDKPCPYDILTDEIRIFCSNLKSCLTNLKNKNINHFVMKHKQNDYKNRCIFIPKTAVTKNKIYKNHLGTMIGMENILDKIENDCRINYIKFLNRYELLIPVNIPQKKIEKRENIVALDLGKNIFVAYYSENTFGTIGENVEKPIIEIQNKIKNYGETIKNKKNKNNYKLRNKNKLKKKIQKKYNKIKNIVKDMHNKTALFLCKKYNQILIPEFNSQQMISNGELDKKTKFVLNMLSHYKFKQHLINKSNEYGCKIKIVTEEYTSLTCTKCGNKSKQYNKREKECMICGYKINRDINGARNIFIKNVKDI